MITIRQSQCEIGVIPLPLRPEPDQNLIVMKATLSLDEKGGLRLSPTQVPCSGPTFIDDDPENGLRRHNDFAPLKPHPEYLLVGTCHPTDGRPTPQAIVTVRVGTLSKELSVFGDRYWRHGLAAMKPSEAAPFTEMPLSWEYAFGGKGFDDNPVGRGIGKEEIEGVEKQMLPNVESRRSLVSSPHSRPEPHSTYPVSPTWVRRTQYAGTYDKTYQETMYPGFAADIDPQYFQAAPADQRFAHDLKGDEEIELGGLIPGVALYTARLPGLRPRAFMIGKERDPNPLTEIALRLDTIYIDTDAMQVELTWRGLCPIDVEELYTLDDTLHAPLSHEACIQKYRARLAAIASEEASLLPDPIPESETAPTSDADHFSETNLHQALVTPADLFPASSTAEETDDDAAQATQTLPRLVAPLETSEPSANEELPTMRLSAVRDPSAPPNDAEDETLQTQALPRVIATGAFDAEMPTQMLPTISASDPAEEQVKSLLDELRAKLEEEGMDTSILNDSAPPDLPKTSETIDVASLRAAIAGMGLADHPQIAEGLDRVEAIQRAEALKESAPTNAIAKTNMTIPDRRQELIDAYEAGEAIEGDFSELDLSGLSLPGMLATGAVFVGTSFRNTDLSGAQLGSALLSNTNMRGANLSGVTLEEADLSDAKLGKANLSQAKAARAILINADLPDVDLREADLTDAECGTANFQQADFRNATLDAADFRGANLSNVTASDSSWVETRLAGVIADGIDLRRSDLTNLRVSDGSSFLRADISGARAEGSRWRESRLSEAVFSFANLNGAIFTGSHLGKVVMDGCDLKKANFQDAVLSEAQVLRSDLMQATFRGANLVDADLRGSNLYEAEFFRAITLGVNFALADLTGTRLESQ